MKDQKKGLFADPAEPGRRSRTKFTLLAGGISANLIAQAALILARIFGLEMRVTEAELAILVNLLVALVAMWFQREAIARAEIAARQNGGRGRPHTLGLL